MKPAPYPPNTRAKGWRFELDYEAIEQSDTWALAAAKAFEGLPLARPLLLATWYAAWRQTPCGSLPADDALAAAAIGIPLATFREYRDVLLRGWWLADDGRLYHDTLVARVIEMMGRRRSDADRQAAKRARDAAVTTPDSDGVTDESRVTPAEVTRESSTDHRPPTSSSPPTSEKKTPLTPRRKRRGAVDGTAERFPEFWLAWPKSDRKQDKAKCLDEWKRENLDAVADAILADVRAKRGTEKWRGGFIEMPYTYLHNRRWEDGAGGPGGQQSEDVRPWHETRAGIEAKGAELGLGRWDQTAFEHGRGEDFAVYTKRVRQAAGLMGPDATVVSALGPVLEKIAGKPAGAQAAAPIKAAA